MKKKPNVESFGQNPSRHPPHVKSKDFLVRKNTFFGFKKWSTLAQLVGPNLALKNFQHIFEEEKLWPKLQSMLRKAWSSVEAEFLHGDKNLNSDFNWGPLHGEIGFLIKQILFCKYLCTSCLRQMYPLLLALSRVQLISFSFLISLTNVSIESWKLRNVHIVS